MQAAELTIPAPAQRGRTSKLAAIATAVTALLLAIAGTVAIAANVLRDGDGYFTWPTETFTSGGYAVAMKTVDISDAPQWAFSDAGLDSVRVKAHSVRPLFIGIARAADLTRYLRGTEYDEVSALTYHPFQVDYDHADGHAPPKAPVHESFWVKKTSGAESLALDWRPRPGNWRAVVMNADGSRGVTAKLQLGARTSLLWWLGAALLGAGVLAAAAAAALYRRAAATKAVTPQGSRSGGFPPCARLGRSRVDAWASEDEGRRRRVLSIPATLRHGSHRLPLTEFGPPWPQTRTATGLVYAPAR